LCQVKILGDSTGLQLVAKFATVDFSSETLLEGKAEGRRL
jgi:hypothetical protein